MITVLAALLAAAPPSNSHLIDDRPPTPVVAASVRITLNGGDYEPGGRVRVQVEPSQDGYLVVFRVDGDGRVRVLFPLDPDLDAFVKGGKRYELRGRGERETFLADDRGGNGLIYAALSNGPLSFGQYAVNEHWDYEALRLRDEQSDPEVDLGDIVRRMAGDGRFGYDVAGYRVHDVRTIASGGRGYNDPFYDPYWSCLSCGWGYGPGATVRIGIGSRWNSWYGYNDPWYYDPWYYDPFAYDAYYGYYGYPSAGGWWRYPGQYRPITVVNLPRPRPETPNTPYGIRARSRPIRPGSGAFAPDLTRSMRPDGRSVVSNGSPGGNRPTQDGRSRSRDTGIDRGRGNVGDERRSSPPPPPPTQPSGRTTQSPPPSSGNSGGSDSRARRRPELSVDVTPRTFEAPVERRQTQVSQPIFREPRREPTIERSRPDPIQSRPVYREPPRVERSSPPPSPPRVERTSSPPPPPASSGGDGRARRRPG
ncbi:MAG: DUF4384 domain-containing protein [Gemmatimonadota bacterium]